MTKSDAMQKLKIYLKSHNIFYTKDIDNNSDRFTMCYKNFEHAPNKTIESCIWFYDDDMEVRVYYTQTGAEWCRNSEHLDDFMRLLNFINANVWMRSADFAGNSFYEPHYLYTPRLYMTEDDCYDITLTTIINYDFYGVAELESEDYITAYCPDLLDKLSPPIFLLLLGKINYEQAVLYVKESILEE